MGRQWNCLRCVLTVNSGDYNSFDFNATNLSNDNIGWAMLLGDGCGDLSAFVGNTVTGTIAGSLSDAIILEPNTDYYFVIWTDDQSLCGEYEYTLNGIYLGCTDETASNYDAQATEDDGSCEYCEVTAVNDTCGDAIVLACDTVINGTTGALQRWSTKWNCWSAVLRQARVCGTALGEANHTLSTCGFPSTRKSTCFQQTLFAVNSLALRRQTLRREWHLLIVRCG